jgi:hypothetical protein
VRRANYSAPRELGAFFCRTHAAPVGNGHRHPLISRTRGVDNAASHSITPDTKFPSMWRVRYPDGSLSDIVNLTRARNAALPVKRLVKLSKITISMPQIFNRQNGRRDDVSRPSRYPIRPHG